MALPINVEELLRQRKVESNRIEFKKGGIQIGSTALSVRLQMTSTISVVVYNKL